MTNWCIVAHDTSGLTHIAKDTYASEADTKCGKHVRAHSFEAGASRELLVQHLCETNPTWQRCPACWEAP